MILDKINSRKPNMFENILLFIGIVVIGIGYFFVHLVVISYGINSFETTAVLLLWFINIVIIIITAVSENSKEELKIIIKQQHDELRLLREDFRRKR